MSLSTQNPEHAAKREPYPLKDGDVVRRGDLFFDGTEYHTMDNAGKVLGVICFGKPIKKPGAWFRPLVSNIDLHCHTTASDGTFSPEEFILEAKRLGVTTVAITDHDTLDGIQEAVDAGEKAGVRVIPGVELSAEFSGGRVHVLGYHIDYTDPTLVGTLAEMANERKERIPKVVKALQGIGFKITEEDVAKHVGNAGSPGRPHVASALVEKGYYPSIKAAMDGGVLSDGQPGDIPRKKLSPIECVQLIANAGGIPVLAHPYQTKLDDAALDKFVGELSEWGLAGIETYYSEHTPEMTAKYQKLAAAWHLIETGGSDWHGTVKPGIELGRGRGGLDVPIACVTALDKIKADSSQLHCNSLAGVSCSCPKEQVRDSPKSY